MTTNAARELIEVGMNIELEVVSDIYDAVGGLQRYSPGIVGDSPVTDVDRFGDYLDRGEVLREIQKRTR